MTNHKLDTDRQVFFYEQEFYVLSNFSSFKVSFWDGHHPDGARVFDTAEQCYHYQKFRNGEMAIEARQKIIDARSAHDCFKIAQDYKHAQCSHWDEIKCFTMHSILWAKASQHEYVSRKLLETGDRELVEDSWRDDVWGWGPNKDGQNMLGKLWMEVRAELRAEGAS